MLANTAARVETHLGTFSRIQPLGPTQAAVASAVQRQTLADRKRITPQLAATSTVAVLASRPPLMSTGLDAKTQLGGMIINSISGTAATVLQKTLV